MVEYKKIQCIEKMDEDLKQKFVTIVNEYAPKLSSRIVMDGSAFTLHDFEHHCFNIYKIISDVLFDRDAVYDLAHGLSQRELFVLNLSVLFHDIGMFNNLGTVRENHSKGSAEYIQAEYNDSRSTFRRVADLSVNELRALKAIIIAHSNVKEDVKNGMDSLELRDYNAKIGIIRSKFLAGILRLADELDISTDRLGTGEIEQQILEGKKKYEDLNNNADTEEKKNELKKWEGFMQSLNHWKKLHFISCVQRNDTNNTIEMIVDDQYITQCLDEGQTEKALARTCVEIYRKIDNEMKEIQEKAFVGRTFRRYVAVDRLEIVTSHEELRQEIDDGLSRRRLISNIEEKSEKVTESFDHPRVLDKNLEKELEEEVYNRNLLKFGHFILNEQYCARDWIDTKEIVETKTIMNKLVDVIIRDINSSDYTNSVIIGIDLIGVSLAARIAFALQKPLSYIVPTKDERNNANQDIELNIQDNDRIILITEAIVTYDTIEKAVEKYNLHNRIEAIYTIFYRPTDNVELSNGDYVSKTYSINNLFKIELVEKCKCIYKERNCIAQNRKIK